MPQPQKESEGDRGEAYLQATEEGVVLRVRVQPRSSKESVTDVAGAFLKARVNAPPVEGAANEACRRLFAGFFDIEKRRVEIVSGLKSREKRILLRGVEKDHILTVMRRRGEIA
ncbi:YggU family protein [Candidatus Poribacteria bacterium]|nr:YggU family protein [Candidatus Poribacteria bacterium]